MTLKYFNVKNGLTTGNITLNASNSNITASTFIGNINATGTANLGSVANVKILGGASTYVLSTDGAGNLTWVAQSGGGGGGEAYNPVLDTFTGTGSQTTFTLSVTPATIYNTIVNIDGVSQLHDAYTLTGADVTFDSAPSNGAIIEVLILATTATGGIPGGSNTQVQYNNDGNFGGSSGLTFDSTTTTLTSNNLVISTSANLGSVSNIAITGGTSGQYLQTDGSGNLSWSTVVSGSTSNISNGNSNVDIPVANGNVTISSSGNANIVVVTGTGVNVSGTINVTGVITGNGSGLSAIAGSNVTGQVANAVVAGTVYTNAQPNITSVGLLTSLSIGPNSSLTMTGTSGYVRANSIQGTDGVSALYPGYDGVTGAVGVTSNLTVGIGVAGNITANGNVTANYFIGNGSQLTGITSAAFANYIANGTSNVNIPTSSGNVTVGVSGNANIVVVTGTGINVAGTINSTGNLTAGNITTGTGSGGSITGGNLLSANYVTGTLTTAAQPNITSVGTLTDLNVSGNAVIGGNLTVNGDLTYVNVTNLSVEDPIIQLQTGPNAAAPTSNSGKDVGSALNYYDTTAKIAFMGWDVSNAEFGFGNSVSISSEVVTFTSYGNVRAGYFIGNGSSLSSITGSNVTGQVGNATVAGTVYTNAQPNITSVGTLTGLTSNGTINFTNASNVSLGAIGNVKITGGTSGQYLQTDGTGSLNWASVTTGSQPGTDFNTSINNVNNYAVTNTMANGAVFGSNVIVYSMYVTNIDSTGSNGAAISANLRYANGTSVILVNQIPVPYRGAVELFKQPKYFANGDAIQFQAFNNGVAANSFFHASVTYQTTTDTTYQYAVTNIATASTATDVYTSTGNASVVQSVMLTNSSNLGNIAVTTTIVNSSNVVQGYLSYELLVPVNSTIELCEQPRNMASGDKLQVTAGGANTVTVTVSARKI